MHIARTFLAAASLAVAAPALLPAQGRLLIRPCGAPPPTCRDCRPSPPAVLPCGARLERVSNRVVVTLRDRVLRYEVTEVFRNAGNSVGEADYIFPLPAGAAFEDLKLSIDGELVAGETMNATDARRIYEEIVRRQRDPALVEWMGSGMLRTRIFPIAPGEEKTVVVRFQGVAAREGDALRVDYRRGTDPVERGVAMPAGARVDSRSDVRAATRPVDEEAGGTWSRFELRYPRDAEFGDAYSPTHQLRTRTDGGIRVVEARGISGDVTVLLPIRRTNTAAMSVLTHAAANEPGFALITITPPAEASRTSPRDVTFVLDVSGSMNGTKLQQAKAAGRALLASLRSGDRFRLIDFSTDVREFRDREWTTVTEANVRAATRYLESLRANGSTNIGEALEVALDAPGTSDGRLPLVVFVTDGEPTVGERSPDALAALAARKRGDARIFSVGVTSGIDATLIEQLAVRGRGTAHFVRENESVEATVSLLARRLAAPVLTDVRLTATGVRLSQMLPAGPIDVFAGQDLVVLARYDGSGRATVRLDGRGVNGPVTWTTTASFPERERANPFVARIWAAQRIGWLAAEKRRSGGNTELDAEIRTLGERFGIPTEFSSYLVLEPGMRDMARGVAAGGAAGNTLRRQGGNANAAAAPPPVASAPARFESARQAAEQRSAKSVSALEAAVVSSDTERSVGSRRFTLTDGRWIDGRIASMTTPRIVRVKPYSALYFELAKQLADVAAAFALGDRVAVAGRTIVIELDTAGIEQMGERELQQLLRDW